MVSASPARNVTAKTYKDIKQAVFDAYPNEPKARLQRTYGTRIIRSL